MSRISRSHRQGSAGSGVKDQPEPCQTSGDAGRSSITRNTTRPSGDERTRTADPLLAKQVLYQLSYVPAGLWDRLPDNSLGLRQTRMSTQRTCTIQQLRECGHGDGDGLGEGDGDIPGLHCSTESAFGARSRHVRRQTSFVNTVCAHHR